MNSGPSYSTIDISSRSHFFQFLRTLRAMLAEAQAPLLPEALAATFKGRITQKRRDRVSEVLETLVATGAARQVENGYFLPRECPILDRDGATSLCERHLCSARWMADRLTPSSFANIPNEKPSARWVRT